MHTLQLPSGFATILDVPVNPIHHARAIKNIYAGLLVSPGPGLRYAIHLNDSRGGHGSASAYIKTGAFHHGLLAIQASLFNS